MNSEAPFGVGSGRGVLSAAQCLVKGALETPGGVHLLTGCSGAGAVRPGAVASFFEAARDADAVIASHGAIARRAADPRAAIADAAGVHLAGGRALVVLDLPGLRAASADLGRLVAAGLGEGAGLVVVCVGDGSDGESDPRLLAEHLSLPWIEPADVAELKSRIADAMQLSTASRTPVAVAVGEPLASSGGTVELRPNHAIAVNANQRLTLADERDLRRLADAASQERPAPGDRALTLMREAKRLALNRIDHRPQKGERVPLGFLVPGASHAVVLEAMRHLDIVGRCPVAVVGMGVPGDDRFLRELLGQCDRVIVIEPGAALLERQAQAVAATMSDCGSRAAVVFGRRLPFDEDLAPATPWPPHPAAIARRLAVLMRDHASVLGPVKPIERETIGRIAALAGAVEHAGADLPRRTPTFVPASPLREIAGVLHDVRRSLLDAAYMQRAHKSGPIATVVHADRELGTLLCQPPHRGLVHGYAGQDAAAASLGAAHLVTNRQIVVADRGSLAWRDARAVAEAVRSGRDVVFLAVDLSGEPIDADGLRRVERSLKAMLPKRGEHGLSVMAIDPRERTVLAEAIEGAVRRGGLSVILCDAPTPKRAATSADAATTVQAFDHIAAPVCELCLECTRRVGDPSLMVTPTDEGPKLRIDPSRRAPDDAVTRTEACPAFAKVVVVRQRAARRQSARLSRMPLPATPRPRHARQGQWRCRIAGVESAGVVPIDDVLIAAGREMGYHIRYRVAGVGGYGAGRVADLVFMREPEGATGAWTGLSGCDTFLGGDALESARALGEAAWPAATAGATCGVIERGSRPTMAQLAGDEPSQQALIERTIEASFDGGDLLRFELATACERLLGDGSAAPLALLGAAYQRGHVPLTLEAIESAINTTHGVDPVHRRAFELGRRAAEDPGAVRRLFADRVESVDRALRRRAFDLRARFNRRAARRFVRLIRPAMTTLEEAGVDAPLRRDVLIRAADCVVWGGFTVARKYVNRVLAVARKDEASRSFAATRAVAWNLAKVVLIKDECYVAALLTSPRHRRRDRRELGVYAARGDRAYYRRDDRPEPVVLGRRVRFEWRSRDWQLRLLARSRFLRKLLPGWCRRERQFRDWYKKLVDRAAWAGDAEYEAWVAALRCPERVTGFREVRYPKMESARSQAESALASLEASRQVDGARAPESPAQKSTSDL